MSSSDSEILGVVLLIRHGDREGFYQDSNTYNPANTAITPLGSVQEFQLGQKLRSIYLTESSSSFISTVNSTIAQGTQLKVRADGGGERGVIFKSAVSLLQGLFPATPASSIVLANGSSVTGPLGGYQYIAIESVEPDNDVSLEGWTSCNTFNDATTSFYNSDAFKRKAAESANFLQQLAPFLDGRPVTPENMWNVFDYMNVQSIHDRTFAQNIPPTFLAQARDLANWHEYGVFSSPQLNGVGNIAGQAILPSILSGLNSIMNTSDPMKLMYEAISYKPFISLFNMTGAAEQQPEIAGVVNYAATVALEVRQPASGEPVVRMNFMNGTDQQFRMLNILGSTGDVPLSSFIGHLAPAAINDTATWCNTCANTQDRGCGAIAAARASGIASAQIHQKITPVGAGFLGAGLTAAVAIIMLVALLFFGAVGFGKQKLHKARKDSDWTSDEESLEDRKV